MQTQSDENPVIHSGFEVAASSTAPPKVIGCINSLFEEALQLLPEIKRRKAANTCAPMALTELES